MSEPIQKVLTNNLMGLPESAKAIGRQNIDAQKTIAYAYSGSTITAIDNSAVGKISTYGYSGDTITSIDGSAVGTPGAFTAVHHDSNLSGSATSGKPLGLYSAMVMDLGSVPFGERAGSAFIGQHTYSYPNYLSDRSYGLAPVFGIMESDSAASIHNSTAFIIAHTAHGIGGGVTTSRYGGDGWYISFSGPDSYIHEVEMTTSGNRYEYLGNTAKQAIYGFGSALFTDNTGTTWETVDASSIRRWNGYSAGSWNESSNSLSTGWGGNQVTAASQFNSGAGNWSVRRVKMSGIPDQDLIGFQTLPPAGTGSYQINAAGAFVAPDLPTFNLKVYKPTTANLYLSTGDYPAMPSTADGLLILVNLGSGPNIVFPDTLGATSTIGQHNSAQLIWDSNAHSWVHWHN